MMERLYENIIIGKEYYFHFQNYYVTGFVILVKGNLVFTKDGYFSYPQEKIAYDNATINLQNVFSIALT